MLQPSHCLQCHMDMISLLSLSLGISHLHKSTASRRTNLACHFEQMHCCAACDRSRLQTDATIDQTLLKVGDQRG